MHLSISHTTRYSYDQTVAYGLQEVRLAPKSRPEQNVLHWKTEIEGGKIELEFEDQHANKVVLISFDGDGQELVLHCSGEVITSDTSGILGKHGGFAPLWYFKRPTDLTRAGQRTRSLTRGLNADHPDPIERMHALSERIREAVTYKTGQTDAETTAEGALEEGAGVCQDHAHVFLAAARAMEFPARYVSGYLMMDDRVDQDATHAWAEAHVKGIGWIGFDVSNGISPDERYVRVATGLDYAQAAPVSGLRWGDHGRERLDVSLQVQQQ